jgi:hypothetical protein
MSSTRAFGFGVGLLSLLCVAGSARGLTATYQAGWLLPPATGGGPGVMEGDLISVGDGAAAVHTRPEGSVPGRLDFRRFGPNLEILVQLTVGDPTKTYYEPTLCFDGANYAVAASTITRNEFMILSPSGAVVLPAIELPDDRDDVGWRTAAFRVLCTPEGYAVFGMVLEPTLPGSSTYYTHMYYWLIDGTGTVLVARDLLVEEALLMAPISYPGFTGLEREYFAVVRAGAGYFLAYSAECGSPAVFQVCYRTLNLAGQTLRAEAPATTITTQGPHLATNGQVIGLATLRQNPPPTGGNYLYARFFELDGTPLAPEVRYDADLFPLGFAPQIARYGDRFLALYAYTDPLSPGPETFVKFAEFDALGASILDTGTVTDPLNLFMGDINLAVDLQLVGDGKRLFGKGQYGIVSIRPILYLLNVDTDEDGDLDTGDNCKFAANPAQENFDADAEGDVCDSCPTVVNAGGDPDGDGVDAACDTCTLAPNPPVALAANRSSISGQHDDDLDGRGNVCDFNYDNLGSVITAGDFNAMKVNVGKLVSTSSCALGPSCGEFDHDGAGAVVTASDFNATKLAVGKVEATAFPKCAACTPGTGWSTAVGPGARLGRPICQSTIAGACVYAP